MAGNTKDARILKEHIEPAKNLASRKSIRLGMVVWAKLDGWPWWPGSLPSYLSFDNNHPLKPSINQAWQFHTVTVVSLHQRNQQTTGFFGLVGTTLCPR